MDRDTFREHYARLTDNELALVLADKSDLMPEAVDALDQEMQRRHFVVPNSPQWRRHPGSGEFVNSLEDYEDYRNLQKRWFAFRRFGVLVAFAPFGVGIFRFAESPVLIFAGLAWAMCVTLYGLFQGVRFFAFECPQCSQSFGRRSECFHCGFPRCAMK